jgi:hypothetical protein
MSLESLVDLVNNGISSVESSLFSDGVMDKDTLMQRLNDAVESPDVRSMYLKDMNSVSGRALNWILSRKGYQEKIPDHYTWLDLPEHVMAATIKTDNGAVILAYNSKYEQSLKSNPLARLYINLHEHAHVRGEHSESHTEGLVKDAAHYLRKAIEPLYGLGRKFRELYDNAARIEQTAAHRQEMQYGK